MKLDHLTRLLPKKKLSIPHVMLITLLMMLVALETRLAIAPVEFGLQYVTFFPAVTLAAVIGGYRAGLLATAFGLAFATYIFTPPYYSISIEVIQKSFWSNMVFLIDGLIISLSIEAMHRFRQGMETKVKEIQTLNDSLELRVKERTAELLAAKESAESANEIKSQFLSRMSHELRTPLNAILGYAQLLDEEMKQSDNAEMRENVGILLESGWMLLRIINDLLDLSSIEAGKLKVVFEDVDAEKVARSCLNALSPMAERSLVTFAPLLGFRGIHVHADSLRLKQVLSNLVSNAVKYNNKGGTVTLACSSHGDRIRITVTDTGSGIAANDLAILFSPFSRLHKRSYEIDGAGIGLAIAKQLTELMNGSIGVESSEGKGSTFWIELESAHAKPAQAVVTDRTEPRRAGKDTKAIGRILYIEDNLTHYQLMKRVLDSLGSYELLLADNSMEGIEQAKNRQPDLIFCDIGLPVLDGYKVLARLKSDPATAKIPVIAISAHAAPNEIKQGLGAGFVCYITKPFSIEDIRDTLRQVLP